MTITHKDYLKIAFPFIISTVTQPLLGAVDTAVIGQLGIAELIGGLMCNKPCKYYLWGEG